MLKFFAFLLCGQLIASSQTPLQGNVEHSTQWAPITESKTWYQIPKWLAGEWQEVAASRIYQQNDQSHSEDSHAHTQSPSKRYVFGWQKDAAGGIWQQEFRHSTEHSNKVTQKFVKNAELIDEPYASFRIFETVQPIEKADVPKITERKETIVRFAPAPWDASLMMEDADTQIYDANGEPSIKTRTVSIFQRKNLFTEKNSDGDRDLKPFLIEFLRQNGYRNLIPKAEPPKSE